jgi:very-short-patch-repair endonuclease
LRRQPGGESGALGGLCLQMEAKSAQQALEWRIGELAGRQHGVITRTQLDELGIGKTGICNRARDGRLRRLHRGVYAVAPSLLPLEGHWLAAVLACGNGAVLSHRAAAALWGLRPSKSRLIDVTVPTRSGRQRRRGIVVHRSALPSAEVTRRRGIPVTTLARTLLDLAEVVTRRALERATDEAERLDLLDLDALDAVIGRNPGRVGAARLRKLRESHLVGSTITKSELEELFLELCRSHSLPSPAVNQRVGPYVVDFLWEEQRLIVETDGRATHGTRAAFERDRARDAHLTAAGYRVVRFTYRQVAHEPDTVARLLSSLLGYRRSISSTR